MIPLVDVRIVLTIISCIGNILVAFALLYAVGTAILLIWPHTLLKVHGIPSCVIYDAVWPLKVYSGRRKVYRC